LHLDNVSALLCFGDAAAVCGLSCRSRDGVFALIPGVAF
jgi:hypothetical protein